MQIPSTETVRIFVKGAPEFIIKQCTKTMDVDGNAVNFRDEEINYIMNDILFTKFTSKGLRSIALAYKDMNLKDFEKL